MHWVQCRKMRVGGGVGAAGGGVGGGVAVHHILNKDTATHYS